MIELVQRTHVYDHIISTIYIPCGGYGQMDIFETMIIAIEHKANNKLMHGWRKVTKDLDGALMAHSDAVTLAVYILQVVGKK